MVERVFLGWDRPFLARAVEWLLERREELPGMLVVLPTAQGGRRLREALAEVAGAVLSPQVVTPGSFLQSHDDGAAADWAERVAWVEVLEEVTDWAEFEALFPEAPIGSNWANGIAREMVALRRSLQENGLLLATAARSLSETVEAERWQALGILEDRVERKLKSWGLQSRSGLRRRAGERGGRIFREWASSRVLGGAPAAVAGRLGAGRGGPTPAGGRSAAGDRRVPNAIGRGRARLGRWQRGGRVGTGIHPRGLASIPPGGSSGHAGTGALVHRLERVARGTHPGNSGRPAHSS